MDITSTAIRIGALVFTPFNLHLNAGIAASPATDISNQPFGLTFRIAGRA
jgi:hypothetical protein